MQERDGYVIDSLYCDLPNSSQSSPMNLSTTTSKREIDNLGDMNVEEVVCYDIHT